MTPVIKRRLLIGGLCAAVVLLLAWQVHRTNRIQANIADLRRGGAPAQDAAEEIAKLGRSARKAVPALVEVLMRVDGEAPGPSPKPQAASALVAIGPAAVSSLLEAVGNKRNRERCWGITPPANGIAPAAVARTIGGIPPLFRGLREMRTRGDRESAKVEAALREHASHDCIHVRSWVRHALDAPVYPYFRGGPFATSDSEFDAIIDRLIDDLHHEDGLVRAWAAHSLYDLGTCTNRLSRRHARMILPALAESLRDDQPMVRYQGLHALSRAMKCAWPDTGDIPSRNWLHRLDRAIADRYALGRSVEDTSVAAAAVEALRMIDPDAAEKAGVGQTRETSER